MTSLANMPGLQPKNNKADVVASFDDGGWGDDWDFDDLEKDQGNDQGIDISSKDYKTKNLNKLSNDELAAEKKKMDKEYNKNFIKPSDPGFQYDRVVDFSKSKGKYTNETNENWVDKDDGDGINEDIDEDYEDYSNDWDN